MNNYLFSAIYLIGKYSKFSLNRFSIFSEQFDFYSREILNNRLLKCSYISNRVTRDGFFLPMLKYDFLQTRYKDLVPISKENDTMDITIIYSPISLGKLRLVLHVEAAMNGLKNLGFSDKDIDEVKGIYADTNVYLLAGTIFIASMHVSILLYTNYNHSHSVLYYYESSLLS